MNIFLILVRTTPTLNCNEYICLRNEYKPSLDFVNYYYFVNYIFNYVMLLINNKNISDYFEEERNHVVAEISWVLLIRQSPNVIDNRDYYVKFKYSRYIRNIIKVLNKFIKNHNFSNDEYGIFFKNSIQWKEEMKFRNAIFDAFKGTWDGIDKKASRPNGRKKITRRVKHLMTKRSLEDDLLLENETSKAISSNRDKLAYKNNPPLSTDNLLSTNIPSENSVFSRKLLSEDASQYSKGQLLTNSLPVPSLHSSETKETIGSLMHYLLCAFLGLTLMTIFVFGVKFLRRLKVTKF